MIALLLAVLLLSISQLVKLECNFSFNDCYCEKIHIDDFLDEFYKSLPENISISEDFRLTIEHSIVSDLNYIPYLQAKIKRIRILNSFLKIIGQDAFEEYPELYELVLSRNKLRNILFVQYLPTSLEKLDLSWNNIGYIDNVFQTLESLKFLDLSHNRIGILDLTVIVNIPQINLSDNDITKIIPATTHYTFHSVNLSRNLIQSMNETALGCSFLNLDLSYNNLTSLEISNEKNVYNLSGNSIKTLRSFYDQVSCFDTLDLSNQVGDIDMKWNILVKNKLVLTNNKISYLSNSSFSLRSMIKREDCYPEVELDNCFILDITEYYFSNFLIPLLNLSYNSISTLRSNVFHKADIGTVDLSHSQIKTIKNKAFSSSVISVLDLSYNEIEVVKNIFDDVFVGEIDFSFNQIKSVFSHSFRKTSALRRIKFSNCQIERIEAEAFIDLAELEDLDLSSNRIFTTEANTFSNLPLVSLNMRGNNITSIRSKAFNNLFNIIRIDLFENGIKNLDSNAFFNLPAVKTIDIRNNYISMIPRDLFYGTKNLTDIYLSGNNITQMNPISNKIKVKNLSISLNGIVKARKLANINIKYLIVEDSEIRTLKTNSLDGLFNLVELSFKGSNIYFIEPGALNHLYRLKILDTQNLFKFTKTIEKNMFKDLKSLEVLQLFSLSLESLDSQSFVGLRSLKSLFLDDNLLSEINKNTFYGLDALTLLDLSNNRIESIADNAFVGLDHLEELYLNNNKINNFQVSLPEIKLINLGNNNFSEFSKDTFLQFGKLEELHLNHNNIEQISVGLFQNLSSLKYLNLSYNQIKSLKNGELSNLHNVTILDLSYNEIGKVQNESVFYSLVSLESLYLDNNHLKKLNFRMLARNLPNLKFVGISLNKWKCETLALIIDNLNEGSINYKPIIPDFNDDNIAGISCIDICKFVYCSPEDDGVFHFY